MNDVLPPFHVTGDENGNFYALAYSEGTYMSPSGSMREDAFLVLYYSPTPEFTRLSFSTFTRGGRLLSYSRGVDSHDNPEFALLKASYAYALAPHRWRLYPAERAQLHWESGDRAHEEGYAALRRALASILYHLRWQAWSQQDGKVGQLFHPVAESAVANPLEPTAENEELFGAAFAEE